VFVPTQAGPLAGDRDSTRIVVGPGATLVIEPVAATLALPGAARTTLRLDVTVHEGGRLVLDEGPLIVAAGADVERRCVVELHKSAVAVLRETIVLGRDGEPPGAVDSTMRVTLAGAPLLHDGFRATPLPPHGGLPALLDNGSAGATAQHDAHVALAPGHRVVATLAMLGARPAAAAPAAILALGAPGALWRASAGALATVDAVLDEPWRTWSREVCAPSHRPRPAVLASA
jgi:urease accessory protein